MNSAISADAESIKFTIEHLIEMNEYSKEEITELLTIICNYCDTKLVEMSDDESDDCSEDYSEDYTEDDNEDSEKE